jgi:hypothetical protein
LSKRCHGGSAARVRLGCSGRHFGAFDRLAEERRGPEAAPALFLARFYTYIPGAGASRLWR